MSYKIVITDNDNGKVLVNEENAVAILGSFTNEESPAQMGFCKCNSVKLACTVCGANEVIQTIKNENPRIGILLEMEELLGKIREDKE